MKFYYNKDWNTQLPQLHLYDISSNEILLQQRLKLVMPPRYQWMPYCSNEILLQQRLKPPARDPIQTAYTVQMKFYYNKDWNLGDGRLAVMQLGSNEILLQQRLKLIPIHTTAPPPRCSNEILLQQRLKHFTLRSFTDCFSSSNEILLQQRLKQFSSLWTSPSSSCSNEILLQQRLKLYGSCWLSHSWEVQMKFYYNKDWNSFESFHMNGQMAFKWNSITTKIETGLRIDAKPCYRGSNEILLQQRLKLCHSPPCP